MAEANLKLERLKNVLSDFQKALECAICLEVVKKPFKLCSRGHLVCVSCLETIESCPTCKAELLLENPVCIQSLLECLPRECRYSDDGCEEMIQDGDDHERFCGFRSVKCEICTQNILVIDLHKHLNTAHSKVFMIKTCEVLKPCTWPKYQTANLCGCLYVSLMEDTFCIFLDKGDDKYLKIVFRSYPIEKPNGDYCAKITFGKENISYVYTLKALPIEDGDGEDDKLENFEADCMKIPKDMLSNFFDKDGRLCYSVTVFKV